MCASECKSESKSKSGGARGWEGTCGCGVCLRGGKLRAPHPRLQVNILTFALAESLAHEMVSKTVRALRPGGLDSEL